MLTNLHVKNIALIDEVDIEFEPGLNILTGETGAGKSVLLGSVNLALGKKMSSDYIGKFADYALVEMIFTLEHEHSIQALRDMGFEPEDGQVILTRKMAKGRSISRINGESCTVNQMKELASLLMDIHGQHEGQTLLSKDHQLEILDRFGGEKLEKLLEDVEKAYEQYRLLTKELKNSSMDQEQRMREIDFLKFELNEIEEAGLVDGEDEELELRFRKMANARNITEALQQGASLIEGDQGPSAGNLVSEASRLLHSLPVSDDQELERMKSQIMDIESLISDLSRDMNGYLEELTFSEEEFRQVRDRLDEINRLKGKYGKEIADILSYGVKQKEKLDTLEHMEEHRVQLQKELSTAEGILEKACDLLHQERQQTAEKLSEAISESLRELNFLRSDFRVDFTRLAFSKKGWDGVEYMIATNPGEPLRPLSKVVSGGELSRIMLAIKTLMADQDDTEVMIFDEIDTGISGRTAQKVSEKMAAIAGKRQIICITHLPQIASMADCHFEISKNVENGRTKTSIKKLGEEDSVKELARILGGSELTEHVLDSAREMKEMAQSYKKAL